MKPGHTLQLIRLALILLVIVSDALGRDPRMRIGVSPLEWGSTCDEGVNKVIAGSCLFVTLDNDADQPVQALKPSWPEGYSLEAALDPAEGQAFEPSDELVARFQPTRYLSVANRYYERRVLDPTQGRPDRELLNSKHFLLIVPADLVGHSFALCARYDRDGLSLVSEPTRPPILVVAACNREDSARIAAGAVYAAYWSGDNERAVQIADSMLTVGLSDAAAWKYAGSAARAIEQYDKAIVYLDRSWGD